MKVKIIKEYNTEFLEQKVQEMYQKFNVISVHYSSFYNSYTGNEVFTALINYEEE